MAVTRLLRGIVMHVPRDPFRQGGALEAYADGAVAIAADSVAAVGEYAELARAHPAAEVEDRRGAVILPGLVDTHVHFPQVPAMAGVGLRLLEWLERRALPEEARYADVAYAEARAETFLRLLAANGTTTALVFGAHFAPAMEAFFRAAERSGLRILAGLCVSDRNLVEPLHTTPERALREGLELARRWHGRGRLGYAVTPRFALSCGEGLLTACRELLESVPGLVLTSHVNESDEEVAAVRALHPAARDYLDVYDRFGLVGERTVLAHDVHAGDRELARLAAAGAAVAHCPSSNLDLGSGLFPLRRHLDAGVRVALGSDVGAGSGFGLFKEALAAHQVQMLRGGGVVLDPARLLYLATGAGARSMGLGGVVGDFTAGREADLVVVRPRPGSTLAEVLKRAGDADAVLGALITLAGEADVEEVRVAGERVHGGPRADPAGLDAGPAGGP